VDNVKNIPLIPWKRALHLTLISTIVGATSVISLSAQSETSSSNGPLASFGESLHSEGINPTLNQYGMYLANPTMGIDKGNHEWVNIFDMGLTADLNTMFSLKGAKVNFHEWYVPTPDGNGDIFGSETGDYIIGNAAAPYIPKHWHLNQLTWEQALLDNQMVVEFGKENAGNHFATPLCNQGYLCQGVMGAGAGMNPAPYANWGARMAVNVTPEMTTQIGYWKDNNFYPFTDGMEGWDGSVIAPFGEIANGNSNLYMVNSVYKTDPQVELYPAHYELMLFYNDAKNSVPEFNSNGSFTGTVLDGKAYSGLYIGGRKTVWRESNQAMATSLSVYSSLYSNFNDENAFGIDKEINAGVTLSGLFESRPFDSYSMKFIWSQLTSTQQTVLENKAAQTGVDYSVGRNEFAAGLDANFIMAGGNVIISPWVLHVWNTNSYQLYTNAQSVASSNDGWAIGLNYVFLFGRALGL
jgi:porin